MINVKKSFGSIEALRGVTLSIQPGEVVGLVGDNGAGKSTLMKMLAGAEIPDSGEMLVDGIAFDKVGPKKARQLGIEMVYQDLALCNDIDVAGNLFLGREKYHLVTRRLDHKRMHSLSMDYLDRLHIRIKRTNQLVGTLSGGQRQAVAIARAVTFDPKVLVLDEPTAALAAKEVETVLQLIRDVSARGVAVILITHRLQDLFEVADRLLVLYEGQVWKDLEPKETSLTDLVGAMMGK
mgnify:FL=1|jgi:simple sugar transport system ATP-binding protein|tara:strand:- start:6676 stop:7386 length:711 start_codon:yes stop_codon:yes gene_type:complete